MRVLAAGASRAQTTCGNGLIDSRANADVFAQGMTGASTIAGNLHDGGAYPVVAISLAFSANARITDHTFVDLQLSPGADYTSVAVWLDATTDTTVEGNDYRRSGHPGFTLEPNEESPFGDWPLLLIDNRQGSTAGTFVRENKFGPSQGRGPMLCRMVYQIGDEATIHHYQSCR